MTDLNATTAAPAGATPTGRQATTVVAVPPTESISIACPPWCTISQEEHVRDLPQLEGFVIHWSDLSKPVYHSSITYIDGTPDPSEGPQVAVTPPVDTTLDSMEAFAYEILTAVQEARA